MKAGFEVILCKQIRLRHLVLSVANSMEPLPTPEEDRTCPGLEKQTGKVVSVVEPKIDQKFPLKWLLLAISVTITPHQPDAFTSNFILLLQHVYMSEALFGADDEDKAWVYLSDLCLFLYNLTECGVWHGTPPLT